MLQVKPHNLTRGTVDEVLGCLTSYRPAVVWDVCGEFILCEWSGGCGLYRVVCGEEWGMCIVYI